MPLVDPRIEGNGEGELDHQLATLEDGLAGNVRRGEDYVADECAGSGLATGGYLEKIGHSRFVGDVVPGEGVEDTGLDEAIHGRYEHRGRRVR